MTERKGFKVAWQAVLAVVLAFAAAMVATPQLALAEEAMSEVPAHRKSVVDNEDGTYTVTLNVTGDASSSTETTHTPVDIVVLFDRSGSMAYEMNREEGTSNARLNAAKNAVNSLASALLTDANSQLSDDKNVQISVVEFSTTADVVQSFTDSASAIQSKVNSITAGGGTNWEAALTLANRQSSGRENAKRYIVFISDGNPTFRITGYDNNSDGHDNDDYYNDYGIFGKDYTYWRDYKVHGEGNGDTKGRNYNSAVAAAKNRGYGVTLYTIGIGKSATEMENFAKATDGSYYTATSVKELTKAFESIISEITKSAAFKNVKITDKLSSWVVPTKAASDNESVPGEFAFTKTDADGNVTELTGQGVTINSDGSFTWDLSSEGELAKGVTYTISFKVKATQQAYDEAAKNHMDDSATKGANNFYTNDNDCAKVDFTKVEKETGKQDVETRGSSPYEKPTITLPTSTITITKVWADRTVGADYVKVCLTDSSNVFSDSGITLSSANNWTYTKTVAAGPEGHDYSVTEQAVTGYDATCAYSVTTRSGEEEGSTSSASTVTLKGIINPQSGSATVTNTRKVVELTVTKNVYGNMGDTTKKFDFTVAASGVQKKESSADVTVTDGKATFSLANSESVTLLVPYGTSVKVSEADYGTDKGGYTTTATYAVGSGSTAELPAGVFTITDNTKVVFSNSKDVIPDTGVSLDSAAPVAIGLIAAAGIAAVAVRGKVRSGRED